MENNWPETIDELMEECRMLVSKTDLYELGERGEPFTGESEPRIDGTDYLAGEYRYGVAMIPAQWVTHVLENATLVRGECELEIKDNMNESEGTGAVWWECSSCHWQIEFFHTKWLEHAKFCPECGHRILKAVGR